jgi:hypothetical protein
MNRPIVLRCFVCSLSQNFSVAEHYGLRNTTCLCSYDVASVVGNVVQQETCVKVEEKNRFALNVLKRVRVKLEGREPDSLRKVKQNRVLPVQSQRNALMIFLGPFMTLSYSSCSPGSYIFSIFTFSYLNFNV